MDPRNIGLAELLIDYSIGLKPGENVLVEGIGSAVRDLVKEIVTAGLAKGGNVYTTLRDDSVLRRVLLGGSEGQIAALARFVSELDPRQLGRPVLMAGQVLEHLTRHAHPTRSEVCHLGDLVRRGYAGIVLSEYGDANGDGDPFNDGDELDLAIEAIQYDPTADDITLEMVDLLFADFYRLELDGDDNADGSPGITDLAGNFLQGGDYAAEFDLTALGMVDQTLRLCSML